MLQIGVEDNWNFQSIWINTWRREIYSRQWDTDIVLNYAADRRTTNFNGLVHG